MLIKIMSNEVREFQQSRKLSNIAEAQHKHLNYRWTPLLVLFMLLAAVGLVIAIVSFIDNINTNNDVKNIYNDIRGTYGSVKAASTAPVLGRLTLRSKVENMTRVIDGITIDMGDSILLKDEPNSQNNGLYTLTEDGYIRSILMDKPEQVTPGNSIYVMSGTVNGGASFMLFYDSGNSFAQLNDVTGPGIIFKNSNSVLLGINAQAPNLGDVPSYDPNEPTVLKWIALSDSVAVPVQTVMVNNTALPAPPAPVNPAIGSLLTNDGTTLFLPAGGAGQVLTSHTPGVPLTWETLATGGTVTNVATGTGLTGGPITATGTISFANVDVQTVMVNNTAGLAPPTPINPAIGSLLTNDGTTLFLPAGGAGQVLTSHTPGVPLTWETPTTGTVTNVATGTGLTGGPITATGTISFDSIGALSIWARNANTAGVPDQLQFNTGDLFTSNGTTLKLSPPMTVGQVLTSNGTGVALTWTSPSSLIIPFVILYTPASGTAAEALAAATWNTRNFDTLQNPTGSAAVTIAGTIGVPAPDFTLASGTWMMSASAPAYRVTNHMIRLVTSAAPAATIQSGTSEQANNSANSAQTRSVLNYTWTIGGSTTYNIQHYTTIAPGAATLGQPLSVATINETYTTIHLLKLA